MISDLAKKLREKYGNPPFGPVGFIVNARTYARRKDASKDESQLQLIERAYKDRENISDEDFDNLAEVLKYINYKEGELVEDFALIVERVCNALVTQYNIPFTDDEIMEFAGLMYRLKCLVAGRELWQAGTKTVDKLGLMSLQNCAFVTIGGDDPVKPFTWIMDVSMLGVGVGYNIQRKYVSQLPTVKHAVVTRQDTKDADFIVPDSREGWVKLLGKLLKAHFYSGKGFTYSTVLLRGKGAPIKSFGGISSGPEVLCEGIKNINDIINAIADAAGGEGKLKPINVLDIINLIGWMVVSGNVRRSAQIAIGDPDDVEFLRAKRWDLGNIPNWRSNSNNSVVCNDISELHPEFWEGYKGKGEPYGLINLELSKSCGRLSETQYPDPDVEGYNPCVPDDTWVLTTEGLRKVRDLIGIPFTAIVNGEKYKSSSRGFWYTGNKAVYRVKTTRGYSFEATDNHKVMTIDGWMQVKDLEKYTTLMLDDEYSLSSKNYYFKEEIITRYVDQYEKYFNDSNMRNVWQFYIGNDDDAEKMQRELLQVGVLSVRKGAYVITDNLNKYLEPSLSDTLPIFEDTIDSIEYMGHKRVYDVSIDNINRFNGNGFILHNCGEQGLGKFETCCLKELILPNIKNEAELFICIKYLYRIAKHSLLLDCHWKETRDKVHKNTRMGIGVTGILSATEKVPWLSEAYEKLRAFDKEYSKKIGVNPSIKLTTVKPSGTLSLLPGVSPGIHPVYSKYYIRRVRIASNSNLVDVCKKHGYPVEYQMNFDGTLDTDTMIISFPIKAPKDAIKSKDLTAIEHMKWIIQLQSMWSDNAVSCTVYYRKEELPAIQEFLKTHYKGNIKTISFLLHSEHGFHQAPLEEITKEKYKEIMMEYDIKPILSAPEVVWSDQSTYIGDNGCEGKTCPIR